MFIPELVTKPTIEGGGGETKTDVYIKARKILDNSISEIKISYKQKNFSFLEISKKDFSICHQCPLHQETIFRQQQL